MLAGLGQPLAQLLRSFSRRHRQGTDPAPSARPSATGFRTFGLSLKLSNKFFVIAALCNLPVFLLGYLFVSKGLDDLRITEKERQGIVYIKEVWQVFDSVLAADGGGAPGSGQSLSGAGNFDVALGTTSQREDFESEVAKGGDAAIAASQDFIRQISDNAGLSNDPDVSTLYAVNVVITAVPEVAAASRGLLGLLDEGSRRVAPSEALSRYQRARQSLANGLNAADSLNGDAKVGAKLADLQSKLAGAEERLVAAAQATAATGGADTLRIAYSKQQAALSAFWRTAADALDGLLARRGVQLWNELLRDLASASGLFVLVSGLVWYLSRSITSRLARLKGVMELMRRGQLEVEVPERGGRDELAEMARAVDTFRSELVAKREADRMLQSQHDILLQRESELETQNIRFGAALENMVQGLCMFDGEQRLVVSNRRYAEIYKLPSDLLKPGTTLAEILARLEGGDTPIVGEASYFKRRHQPDGSNVYELLELEDGRVISIAHTAMADGGWVSTHQDVTDQRRNEARIRHLAGHDALTDLPNRTLFREHMDEAETRIRRQEQFAFLCIDLDHFKTVNDGRGHGVGDAVLRSVAERLRDCCTTTDIVARLGGDEFVVLQGGIDGPDDAAALAGKIVKAVAEPFDIGDHRLLLGASIGIAVAPLDGLDGEELMKRADLALYRAKTEGRSTYHFYEPDLDAALQERRAIEAGLRTALSRNELRLVFQPLFNLGENRMTGVEALLRWDHPERGPIEPNEFIPVAEESGLIVPIGEWVLREACAAAVAWPDNIQVAVNLSAVQFRNHDLVEHVTTALQASGLATRRLELEITESVLLADNESALRILHELRGLGIRISMDDFGTGYSSLSYLRSFPFDKIKIDQSFLNDSPSSSDGVAIIKAVIGLGQSLGMATTVEGVETEAQLELVRAQGCTEVQGFLFSPPLPEAAVSDFLSKFGAGESQPVPVKATA